MSDGIVIPFEISHIIVMSIDISDGIALPVTTHSYDIETPCVIMVGIGMP